MPIPHPNGPSHASASPADTAAIKHGMSSLIRTTLWAGLVAILLGLGSVPWLCSNPARISQLIARAVPGLKADVSIGAATIGWTGPIVLEDVRIVPRNGAKQPLAIKRIQGSHGLAGMLLSLGDLGRFRVEGLKADIVFDANRDSNLTGLFVPETISRANAVPGSKASASQTAGDPAMPPPTATRSLVRFHVDLEGVQVNIRGPWAEEVWSSDPIDIHASLGPAAAGGFSEWSVQPVQLLRDAKLEASVAQGVLAYIVPAMADATRTSGRFSLRLDGATLPVGSPESARLSGLLEMHEVNLGPGPLVKDMLKSLPGRLQLPTSVRIADESAVEFRVADRRVWHKGLKFGVPLSQIGQRLDVHSSGSVGLDDKSLNLKLSLPLPAEMPADRPLLAALAGKTFSILIGGSLGEPKVNFDGSLRASAASIVSDRTRSTPAETASVPDQKTGTAEKLDQLKSNLPADIRSDPSTDAIIDLVGGIFDEVAKRRADRAAAVPEGLNDTADPQQPVPPRRGRLLRRLAQPPTPAQPVAPSPASP